MSRRTTERERSPAEGSGRINIRIKPADKALVGRTVTEALSDTTLLRVDPEIYVRFVEFLDKPPQPSGALRKLLQQKAPWEG